MFIGRIEETKIFEKFITDKSKRSFLLYGKRRVGKTELIKKSLGNKENFIYYECSKDNLDNNSKFFGNMLIEKKIISKSFDDLSFKTIFSLLNLIKKDFIIVIDEYPYLYEYEDRKKIDSIFQTIIDNNLSNIKIVLCGSNVAVMQSLIEENNALFGRFDLILPLKELNYKEAQLFYNNKNIYDKIALYSIFGGSPYLNLSIDSNISVEDNIKNNFLDENSNCFRYCENLLFTDVPSSININALCTILKNGKKTCAEIESQLNVEKNGGMNKKLELLVKMGLINKYQPINKKGNNKATRYEIKDNAIRFFYSFIYNNKSILNNIGPDRFYKEYIKDKLTTFISHRFEEIVRDYFSISVKDGQYEDVIDIGTYYYDDPKNKTNGEFDVVLKTKKEKFIVCEVKYYKDNKLSLKEMSEEYNQIKKINELNIEEVMFISSSGFEKNEYKCINIEEIYR